MDKQARMDVAMTNPQSPSNRWLDAIWFLAFAAVSSAWLVTAGQALGPTFDEPIYLEKGLEHWRTGSYFGLLRLGTMPLPVDVQTLPIYWAERAQGIVFDYQRDMDMILPMARRGNLLFWWLLLFFGMLIGKAIGGPWGGRLAVTFLAIEPSFLGHACLATTDLSVTACFLGFVYLFWRGRDLGWWGRVAWPALGFGLLVLTKASGMVFAPIAMLAIETHRLKEQFSSLRVGTLGQRFQKLREIYRPLVRDGWRIAGWGFLLVFVYCGSDWQPEGTFLAWSRSLPDNLWGNAMFWLADHLRIFPNAAVGLLRQVKHNVQGHNCFLLGEEHNRALWYYFPVLLTIKLSLPLLLLPIALACGRGRTLLNWAFVAFLALMLFSFTFRVQIGIRMILPLVALGTVGLAGGLGQTIQAWKPGLSRRLALGMLTGCLLWTAVSSIRVWPHGLCFTNEIYGNTTGGYFYVSDSNYDWGQGLKDLAQWRQAHPDTPMAIWYFGSDPACTRPDFPMLSETARRAKTPDQFWPEVRGKVLAVSTSHLYGGYSPDSNLLRSILRPLKPRDRTPTFLLYDFREETNVAAR